jgi:hypothetical protein
MPSGGQCSPVRSPNSTSTPKLLPANTRDLLTELATSLRGQIADAKYRFQFVDRQINAQRNKAANGR